jgi:hypothetical protein
MEDWRLLGSSLLDSFNQDACRDTALLLVHLMVAGEASNDGGNGEVVRPEFRVWGIFRRRRRIRRSFSSWSFYTALERASSRSGARGGRQHDGETSTASPWPPVHGGDEDELLSLIFQRRGMG